MQGKAGANTPCANRAIQDYVPMDYMRCWNHHQDILARAMRRSLEFHMDTPDTRPGLTTVTLHRKSVTVFIY